MDDANSRVWKIVASVAGGLVVFIVLFEVVRQNVLNWSGLPKAPSPRDFVTIVQRDCWPTVRAIKQYRRDYGHMPSTIHDLQPKYLQAIPAPGQDVDGDKFFEWTPTHYLITYDFSAPSEGWFVAGPSVRGSIPAPLVTLPSEAGLIDGRGQPETQKSTDSRESR